MNRKLLVLGGSGFIGQSICRYFSQFPEFEIIATNFNKPIIEIDNVAWEKVDLHDLNQTQNLFSTYYDYVINAAAVTSGSNMTYLNPNIHVLNNIRMNVNIFEAMNSGILPTKYIFLSCTVMYPSSDSDHNELEIINQSEINSRYFGIGNTKLFIEQLCKFYSMRSQTSFVALRHSNIYGPYDKFDNVYGHVLSSLLLKANTAQKTLEIWGDGTEVRDFLYITDFLEAIDVILRGNLNKFDIYNLGSGKSYTINQLAENIIKIVNPLLTIKHSNDERQIKVNIKLDSSKFKKEFGWQPKIELDTGLKLTQDWLKSMKFKSKFEHS
jgi:nucleoside-diphosphate-sugar epimerase